MSLRFVPFIALILLLTALSTVGCAAQEWATNFTAVLTPAPTTDPLATPTFGPTITREPTASPTATPTLTPTPTVTPTPTPTRVPEIISYSDPQEHLTLDMPDNWLVRDDDEEALILASDETRLNFNTLDQGAVILLFPGEVAISEPVSPTAVLDEFIANFVVFDTEEVVETPSFLRIGGQNTAVARAVGVFNRFPVLVEYYAFVRQNRFVVVVIMLADESAPDYQPVAERIARSIRLR